MRRVNGRIYTQDEAPPLAAAVACAGGRFTAVGDAAGLPEQGETIDLRGRTVLPGLIDAHAHLRNLAETRLAVNLGGASSVQAAAGRVAQRAAERSAGE